MNILGSTKISGIALIVFFYLSIVMTSDDGASIVPTAIIDPYKQSVPSLEDTFAPTTTKIYLVGDSLGVGIDASLKTKAFERNLSYESHVETGQTILWGVKQIHQSKPSIGATVIVSLGTNDAVNTEVHTFAKRIDSLMTAVGPGNTVHWLTLDIVNAEPYNSELHGAQARWTNLKIIDWDAYTNTMGIKTGSDGIHYSPTNYVKRANFVISSLVGE